MAADYPPCATHASPSNTQFHRSPLALATLLLGGFITVFDLFVVNVAIPSMQATLAAGFAEIGWVIAGYELAFGILLIAGGRLGDRYGRRRLFRLGLWGFVVASCLCGLAPDAHSLIVARFLQGMAAAMLFPQIYALLRVMYDDDGRRRAFGLLGMTLGLAAIAGQVLGGLLVEGDLFGLGWRIIFLINLPVGAAALLATRALPESSLAQAQRVDWRGIGLASTGLLLLLLPLLEGPHAGWPRWTGLSMALSLLMLLAFLRWEGRLAGRSDDPAIDTRLFRNLGFSLGSLVVLLIYSTASSLFLCFALLVQTGLGLTPFAAGTLFAPASVGFIVASMLAPNVVARVGSMTMGVGALLYAAGIGWLMAAAGSQCLPSAPFALMPALLLFGFGQGLSMTPLLNLVLGYVQERHAGMAAGFISTMQQVGGAFGVAIAGLFFVNTLQAANSGIPLAERYADAFSHAMRYNVTAVLLAALLIFWLARYRPAGR